MTILSALALAVRLPQLDHRVFVDELLHVLAARSVLGSGTLQITADAPAPYTRARLFTYLVAGMFRIFGETLVVSRIPALAAGVVLILVLFLWLRSVAGGMAAWTAAVLLCLNPEAIYLSQWCRFYTFQSLFLMLGAMAAYELVERSRTLPARAWLASAVLVCLVLAMHFQVLSTIAILALAMWAALTAGPALVRAVRGPRARWDALALAVIVVAGAVLIFRSGFAQYAWRLFRYAAPWAESARDDYLFYHSSLLGKYATLWTLFPLAFLVAVSAYPRPAWFCGSVFGAGIAIQSLAAWKANRYFFWAMPFFFATVGMAFDPAVRWIQERLRSGLAALWRPLGTEKGRAITVAALALAVVFGAAGNRAFLESYSLITDEDSLRRPIRPEPNWEAAMPTLGDAARDAEVVLSSSGPKSLFFLQRLDFMLSSQAHDDRLPEVGFSDYLGVPRLRTAGAVRRVVECHGTGLVVIERGHLGGGKVTSDVLEYLSEHSEPLPLPSDSDLLAFQWDHPRVDPEADCNLVWE